MSVLSKREKRRAMFWGLCFVLPHIFCLFYFIYLTTNEKYENLYYKNVVYYAFNLNFWGTVILLLIVLVIGYKFIKKRKKLIFNSSDYYRDIPCDGNLILSYWLLKNYSDLDEKKLQDGLFKAYILKWLKDKKILILDDDKFKLDNDIDMEKNERKLFNILKQNLNSSGIFSEDELIGLYKNRDFKYKLKKWYVSINDAGLKYAKNIDNDYTNFDEEQYKLDIENNTKNLLSLKNFLLNFSTLNEKKYIDVMLWENYLVFAELFGIADEVNKQFNSSKANYSSLTKLASKLSSVNFFHVVDGLWFLNLFIQAFLLFIFMGFLVIVYLITLFQYII